MRHGLIRYIIGVLVFLVIFPVMFVCTHVIADYLDFHLLPALPSYGNSFLRLFLLAISTIFAISMARYGMRWYSRKYSLKIAPLNRRLASAILIGYILTAFIGVPTVQNSNLEEVTQEHKRVDLDDKFKYPYDHTYVAVPVLPFVVLSYHEYGIASLYALGLWDLQVWYVFGVKRLLIFPLWIA